MDTRRNLQAKQPYVTDMPEGNGWPEPLVDNSDQIKTVVMDGKMGESRMNDGINTSQAKTGGWKLPEGSNQATPSEDHLLFTDARDHTGLDSTKTFQQLDGGHSDPGGDTSPVITEPHLNEDELPHVGSDLQTSQQKRGEHKRVEG